MRHINIFSGGPKWGVSGGGQKVYVERVSVLFLSLNGGSSAAYLAHTPRFVLCFSGAETERAFRLPGVGGDHFHCTLEPSPGHFQCRSS